MNWTIDVLIPAFNPGSYFEPCLKSCIQQSYSRSFRLIVVDDGSTEDLWPIVEKFQKTADIFYLRSDKNRGAASARNLGIRHSHADLLFFHDADDLMCPDRIETTVNAFNAQPELVLVCGNWRWIVNGELEGHSRYAQEHPIEYATLLFDFPICSATVAIKREVLDSTGCFNEDYVVVEDYDLWVRIVRQYPHQIKYIHQDMLHHNRHATPHSLTKKYMWTEEHRRILSEMRQKYRLV